jgi:hypothetical protein
VAIDLLSARLYEDPCLSQVLQLTLASRNGISESELMDLCPTLTWNTWAPMCDALIDRYILTFRSGLLVFAHQQVTLIDM